VSGTNIILPPNADAQVTENTGAILLSSFGSLLRRSGTSMMPFSDRSIDLLVHNAGIYMPKPFTQYTPVDLEMMIGTNVAGYSFITQHVAAQMRKQKSPATL
jgi:NAD(P)-dependent dehydrogenase (short-subunit alcohol dehydrogenase family)